MVKQTDATIQEVFSKANTADSIRLQPWCISSTVPLCYMSGVLATAMQQEEDVPATIIASEPEDTLAPGHSSSPIHPPGNPPFCIHPLLDIPFIATPPVGCPLAELLAVCTEKKWDCSPSDSLGNHHNKKTCVVPRGQG